MLQNILAQPCISYFDHGLWFQVLQYIFPPISFTRDTRRVKKCQKIDFLSENVPPKYIIKKHVH